MAGKQFYQMSVQEVLDRLESHRQNGLDSADAARRLARFGPNKLRESASISPWSIFLNQFQDFMVLILLVATGLSFFLGEIVDAATITAIIILNAVLGFVQEYRAEQSLATLRKMTAPTARVCRDGHLRTIEAESLVPGDIMHIEAGDRIAADARLIEAFNLDVEESALTGESVPVAKQSAACAGQQLPLGDQRCMVFQGTVVTRGRGIAVVCATGMETEMGKIAGMMEEAGQQETPLQRKLDQLGKFLVIVCGLISALVVAGGILQGQGVYRMFLAGVSLAVPAIPEGLPAIVTIALALGVQRMIKANAIVRKLPAVETLGCATVICSDKTGTLTKNEMTVCAVFSGNRRYEVSGDGYQVRGAFYRQGDLVEPQKEPDLWATLKGGVICNNASLDRSDQQWNVEGDPTEASLLVAGAKAGLYWPDMQRTGCRRVGEIPFDSERKRMSVVLQEQNTLVVYVKGAPDQLIGRCDRWLHEGRELPFREEDRRRIITENERMAQQALRVLAVAYKRLPEVDHARFETAQAAAEIAGALSETVLRPKSGDSDETHRWDADRIENQLVFAGLIGMMDPPRPEVYQALGECKQAGLRAVMITGDHKLTAAAIANQLGMLPPNGRVVSGLEMDRMTDQELEAAVHDIYVYARVSPMHKMRVVRVLKKRGNVVAMTGDGVNDAPAVKEADIGVSMGMKGTDVTKEASDLVLTDDNFATIVAAIREGRAIFENIRKFVRYLLACNTGEVMVMLLATLLALPLPLLPIQILLVNLVTDGLPAIALGVDPAAPDIMRRPPRNPGDSIFAGGLWVRIIERGVMIGLASLAAFFFGSLLSGSLETGRTMATATLVLSQLLHVFDCRSERPGVRISPLSNRALLIAVASSFAVLLAVIYAPLLQASFKTVALDGRSWAVVVLLALSSAWFARILQWIGERFKAA